MNTLPLILGFVLVLTKNFYSSAAPNEEYIIEDWAAPTQQTKYLPVRTTEIHNYETYEKCESKGRLNVVRIGRDELFFLNMSCANYYMSNPLARESFGITLGDQVAVLAPTVNFTITNVVKEGLHYEIHEGIVADADLINATVTKVKVFDENDFQKGCAQEPGLKFIRLLRSDITFRAPKGDYEFSCQAIQQPGLNQYNPGIVYPEVLQSSLKSNTLSY